MAESAEGSPRPSDGGIPFFRGNVLYGKMAGPDGKPVFVITYQNEWETKRYPFEWEEARRILVSGVEALDAQHIDVVRNGNGKLWKPNG